MNPPSAQDLIVLMAFAGDQHQIPRSGLGNGGGNGGGPIGFHHQSGSGGNARHHIRQDLGGVLRPGVVGGHHDPICQAGGDGPHLRSLAAVAIPAAAEHTDQLALGEGPAGVEGTVQAIGGVGVIHQHRRLSGGTIARPAGGDPLHPARHTTKTGQPLQQHRQGKPQLQQAAHRLQLIHQVEAAQQGRAERPRPHRTHQDAADAIGTEHQLLHAQFSGAARLEGTAPALGTEPFGQAHAPGIIHIHHGGGIRLQQRRLEQLGLGLEIGLHRGVVIEVVLGEVGENRPGELAATDALLVQGMGTHLHRPDLGSRLGGLGQLGLEHIRKGRGVLSGDALARPAVHQSAEQGRRGATTTDQMLDQMGGGGLAVGAGHTDQAQPLAGVLPELSRQQTGPARHGITHHQHGIANGRGPRRRCRRANHHRHSAGRHRLWPEAAAIHHRAGQTHKQGALAHAPGIAAQTLHRTVLKGRRHRQAHLAQQGMEQLGHGPAVNTSGPVLSRPARKSVPLQPNRQTVTPQPR